MKKKEVVIIFSMFVCVFGIVHFMNFMNNDDSSDISYDSKEAIISEVPIISEEIEPREIIGNLQNKYNNKDIIGELRIQNTDFKTPIPQGKDNLYYYRRLPNKKSSIIGSTFMDYRTEVGKSKVLIIYGHNSSKYNMPFKVLENYYDSDYYLEHKYIDLITIDGIKTYEVFSVYVETSDFSYYYDIEFNNASDYYKHISKLKSKSLYNIDVPLNEEDNILIMQACSTNTKYKNYAKKFILIISKEVREDEID